MTQCSTGNQSGTEKKKIGNENNKIGEAANQIGEAVLLNGPSSSGKSTISAALQTALRERGKDFAVVSIDDFLQMDAGEVIYEDDVFEISQTLCDHALLLLKEADGIIIDHVITSQRIFEQLESAFSPFSFFTAKVTGPMDELNRREALRGDRCPGSAASSLEYLYPQDAYDITVDTFAHTPKECALQIIDALRGPSPSVSLRLMTRELCHELYKGFENDPDIYTDMSIFKPFVYSEDGVNALFDRQTHPSRRYFAIMLEGKPIGEIKLKGIDRGKKECTLGIHMQSDAVKDKGYGTAAEKLALAYAFDELGMQTVLADAVLKNKRSQHILEKIGFVPIGEDDMFLYYQADKESVQAANARL
ncbi:MAG: GNAT family N-acetyltransferase [Clostridiales bacterium]|nr:GNAT family N-acetyltransferase [Clostridiales bacterium]